MGGTFGDYQTARFAIVKTGWSWFMFHPFTGDTFSTWKRKQPMESKRTHIKDPLRTNCKPKHCATVIIHDDRGAHHNSYGHNNRRDRTRQLFQQSRPTGAIECAIWKRRIWVWRWRGGGISKCNMYSNRPWNIFAFIIPFNSMPNPTIDQYSITVLLCVSPGN